MQLLTTVIVGMLPTVDAAAMEACASIDVTILAGVLVFSSVLELVRRQDEKRYSLDDRDNRVRVAFVIRMVTCVIGLSATTAGGGLVAMSTNTSQLLRQMILASSVLVIVAFATLAIIVVRWMWK